MSTLNPERPLELPEISALADADVLITDGADGLRRITHTNYRAQLAGIPASSAPTNAVLKEIVSAEGYELINVTYDADGVKASATVLWPDGSPGVYTVTAKNSTWLDIDAYTITHANSGKTVTQSAMTRNELGDVTVKPALTVS